jgi:hypothetical protein
MATSIDTEPSVNTLRARAEANRSRLTGTVEELRTQVTETASDIKERLSPSAIKAEVSDYVRDSRDQMWNTLEQKARDNPLQALAVGAAVAYPALKLLRAMPAPLLLIGAGLFLSRSSAQSPEMLRQASDAVRTNAQGVIDKADTAIGAAADATRRTFHDAKDAVQSGVETVVERTTETVDALRDRMTDAADGVKAAAAGTLDTAKSQAEEFVQHARQTVSTTWDQNPLVVAGIGLAIGAVLAAAFPTTKAENAVFGDANDALQRKAGEAVAKGVDAAQGLVDGAAREARQQGLSVDGLNELGNTLNEKLRAVAERGVAAALNEPKPTENFQSTNQSRDHQS